MRTFVLQRDTDITGISGTGIVAEGVEWTDGSVAVRWSAGEHQSTVLWDSIDSVIAINGHNGSTRVVWGTDADSGLLAGYEDVTPNPIGPDGKRMDRPMTDAEVIAAGGAPE